MRNRFSPKTLWLVLWQVSSISICNIGFLTSKILQEHTMPADSYIGCWSPSYVHFCPISIQNVDQPSTRHHSAIWGKQRSHIPFRALEMDLPPHPSKVDMRSDAHTARLIWCSLASRSLRRRASASQATITIPMPWAKSSILIAGRPKMQSTRQTSRARGIPLDFDKRTLANNLPPLQNAKLHGASEEDNNRSDNDIRVHTLKCDLQSDQVTTIPFRHHQLGKH